MIKNIKLLQNIGIFSSDSGAASLDFKRLVLIYGENGTGKNNPRRHSAFLGHRRP